jgi:hypothetical protein
VKTAGNIESYQMTSYTFPYHQQYGGDELDTAEVKIGSATVDGDGMGVVLECTGLREGYVHELHAEGVRAKDGARKLLHPEAFYTLNAIPE